MKKFEEEIGSLQQLSEQFQVLKFLGEPANSGGSLVEDQPAPAAAEEREAELSGLAGAAS